MKEGSIYLGGGQSFRKVDVTLKKMNVNTLDQLRVSLIANIGTG